MTELHHNAKANTQASASSASQFHFTDKAAHKVWEILQDEPNAEGLCLRIFIQGGGCAGFQYQFLLEDRAEKHVPQDHFFEQEGTCVVVDDLSFDFLKGARLEYQEEMIGSSFMIQDNPQAQNACGCKSSFSVAPGS